MTLYILLIATLILPFLAEAFAHKMPTCDSNKPRSLAFYILTPVMGLIVYLGFAAVAAHPLLAFGGSVLFYGGLTAVSNKKYEVLKSPFNAHDFDNLRNLYIYPEFYISYIGWPVLALVIGIFLAVVGISFVYEDSFIIYELSVLGQLPIFWGYLIVLICWLWTIKCARLLISQFFNEDNAHQYGITFELEQDIARFGLFPTVMLYRLLLKMKVDKKSLRWRHIGVSVEDNLSDIIAIQGESFFDLERLFTRLPKDQENTWITLRNMEKIGVMSDNIAVPAWGAYTMQTEFSFLSMLKNDTLGIDRINPYMRFSQQPVTTIANLLKESGYRTVCIHPAKKEFFRRASVMPNLGFDEFIGIEAFASAPYFGKYISDEALGEKIKEIIADHHTQSSQPLFVFAITIESHGPWANDRLSDHLDEDALIAKNPTMDHEFTLYQEHMENLMALYRRLSVEDKDIRHPRTVALYGDHMPALAQLFDQYGFNDIPTTYLAWHSNTPLQKPSTMKIEDFGEFILKTAGIEITKPRQ